MQEDIFPDRLASKLYSENSIRVGTLLGGPLVAGYLIADNYKQLGENKKTGPTWIIAIVATIAIFIIVYFLPEKTPKPILPIVYSLGSYLLAQNLQGKKIKEHIDSGGETWSVWRAVLAGMIGFIVIAVIIFFIFFLLDQSFI